MNGAAAKCSIRIRPTVPGVATFLNVGEVYLYDASGTVIKPLAANLSSTYDQAGIGTFPAANCIDGNTATICSTYDPANGDPNPTLHIMYACPGGAATAVRAVVHNRADTCCQERLNQFSLDFLNSSGKTSSALRSFKFTHSKLVYTAWGKRELCAGASRAVPS